MTNGTCDDVRDLFPEWLHGSLDPVRAKAVDVHLDGCPGCREEMSLLEAIRSSTPTPPAYLEPAIQARLREEVGLAPEDLAGRGAVPAETRVVPLPRGRRLAHPWWLSAAALLAVALGIGVLWRPGATTVEEDPVQVAVQDPPPEAWLWDDGMVAGAPVFDELTEEELQALIEEFGG